MGGWHMKGRAGQEGSCLMVSWGITCWATQFYLFIYSISATKITSIKPCIPNNCEMTALLVSQYSLRERQTYRHREREQRERERERDMFHDVYTLKSKLT